MTTPIIAICNHKGGSGKTTTAWNLALAFTADPKNNPRNILIVDLDDQATLTQRMVTNFPDQSPSIVESTIADALDGSMTASYIFYPGLDYIPADHRLAWVAAKMQASSPNHAFLARVLRRLTYSYDLVLLDCPPSAGIIMINALAACTHTVIPVTASEESWDGRQRMETMIAEIANVLGKQITNLGAVLAMRSPRSKTQDYYEALNAQAGLLGAVPHAVGLNADKRIYTAYEPIASAILAKLAQE